MNFAIVGSGFSGSILSKELSEAGHSIDLFEERNHIGGNCYTYKDVKTGIIVHKYGPHIFHTDDEEVWNYINRIETIIPFINRVKTTTQGNVYSLPINLHTINQFFKLALNPSEAKKFISDKSNANIKVPNSFEDQALKFIGEELYETFFKNYTKKQWGIDPKKLPENILKRLPIRFNYNDNYFNSKFQGIPQNGYSPIFDKLIDRKLIRLRLKEKFYYNDAKYFDHVFYTGPIDSLFEYKFGYLGYRTLDFEKEIHNGDFQGCAVMNYPDTSVPFTRITEHKHFTPWNFFKKTIIFKEYSRNCEKKDIPYYPIRLSGEMDLLNTYLNHAKELNKVSFLGRLGTYRYLDMDVSIKEAMQISKIVQNLVISNESFPSFF